MGFMLILKRNYGVEWFRVLRMQVSCCNRWVRVSRVVAERHQGNGAASQTLGAWDSKHPKVKQPYRNLLYATLRTVELSAAVEY